jgi:WD40 repeat protein
LRFWDLTSDGDTGFTRYRSRHDHDLDEIRLPTSRAATPTIIGVKHQLAELTVTGSGRRAETSEQPAQQIVLTEQRRTDRDPPQDREWRVTGPELAAPVFIAQGAISRAVASEDGHVLVCFGHGGDITVWDLREPSLARVILPGVPENGHSSVTEAVLRADCGSVAFLTRDGTLNLVDLDGGSQPTALCTGVLAPLWRNADGSVVAARSGKEVHLWDLRFGARLLQFTTADADAATAIVGDHVYWLTERGSLGRYDLVRRRRRRNIASFGDSAVIEPGGRFACAPTSMDITVWDLLSARPLVTISAGDVTSCALAPDVGRGVLATAGPTLTVWDVSTAVPFGRVTGDTPFASCHFEDEGDVLRANALGGSRHTFAVTAPTQPFGAGATMVQPECNPTG